ncbi:ATP-binding protein [Microcella sp.]|uniref:ATP-binding protein n=1 Tax=Microcella sp. TaxID=1913979 RepID=UPI002563123B|nr:ATP-binding protein [Microcella sp.]MBX9472167.1 MASE1 domain-containing protein [Microcella sp.]
MSIIARLAASSDAVRRVAIALLIGATAVAAYAAVAFSFVDPELAAWWPAAGFASVAAMLARGRERWLVLLLVVVATGSGNLLAGRDPLFAALLAVGNTLEVAIIAAMLAPAGVPSRLSTLLHSVRFIAVALLAAAATGAALAIAAMLFLQRPLLEGFAQLTASHASATLVMLPLFMVPIPQGLGRRWLEVVTQSTFLIGLVLLVFWPGNTWPIAFLPVVAFLWSAFRFPMLVSAAQMLATAAAVIVLTLLGGGPFALVDDGGGRIPVVLIQTFLLVYAITALLTCAARADWLAVVVRLRAQEELLREGIVAADAGIFIAERAEHGLREVARNDLALRVFGADGPPFGIAAIDQLVKNSDSGQVVFERDDRTYEASIAERGVSEGPGLVTIVISDVTERDERERVALESADQLRRLNDQKDDFISAVSHELRTPVTSILGFSEQLEASPLPPEAAQAGAIIARNARRLADVIDDVLELSRLSALGGPRTAPETIDLVTLAAECARDSEGLVLSRRVSVTVSAPDGPVVVRSRTRELERVCANLLSNAVKFSHDDGTVTIEIQRDGEGAVVHVIDHGLGIPAEHRDMVWERFARAPVDSHRAVPGTGLGLPIVRALVETRLGGTVSITETQGGGTTAIVRLPSEAPALSLAHEGD